MICAYDSVANSVPQLAHDTISNPSITDLAPTCRANRIIANRVFKYRELVMNFLAHSLFAKQNRELIVGQFCGDFVRGASLDSFPVSIRHGIALHRKIDMYTDQHPINLKARRYFKPPQRRFASILTDVVYDHYLARNWSLYSDSDLHAHVALIHLSLEKHFELLPARLQRFARLLIDEEILLSYLEFDAVNEALERISWRSSRFEVLAQAGPEIKRLDKELSQCFAQFFPDLVAYVASLPPDLKVDGAMQ